MQDREIQNGGKLTVRDSQAAVFVNEGKVADIFGPGLYTLTTQTLPILTYLRNWDKAFKSPFKSDVYFFSARIQTDQHWGTQNPISIRDKEFGAIRLRGFGIYSYHLSDAKSFYSKISGTRDLYRVADLEGQLRNTIVAKMTDAFAASQVPFLDMAANQGALAEKNQRDSQTGFHGIWTHPGQLRGRKPFAPGRVAESARPAHQHERARRHGQVYAISSGPGHPHRGPRMKAEAR